MTLPWTRNYVPMPPRIKRSNKLSQIAAARKKKKEQKGQGREGMITESGEPITPMNQAVAGPPPQEVHEVIILDDVPITDLDVDSRLEEDVAVSNDISNDETGATSDNEEPPADALSADDQNDETQVEQEVTCGSQVLNPNVLDRVITLKMDRVVLLNYCPSSPISRNKNHICRRLLRMLATCAYFCQSSIVN